MRDFLMNAELWVLVAFLLFFVLFGGRLWKALAGMLDGRAESIRIELAEAARLRAEAEAMLRDAEAARTAAFAEAKDVLERSRIEAARLADAAQADAVAQAKRRERMALDRIAAAEKATLLEVRNTAADIAATAARAVIAETLTADRDAAIIDRAIAAMPKAARAA